MWQCVFRLHSPSSSSSPQTCLPTPSHYILLNCHLVAKSYLILQTHGLYSARDFPGKKWVPFPYPGDLPSQEIELRSPALAGFFMAEPQGH